MASSRYDSPAHSLKSDPLLNALWQSTIDGIRVIDEQCRIVMVNAAYCRLVDRTEMELMGSVFYDVYSREFHEEARHAVTEAFKTRNSPPDLEREVVLWNASKKCFEISNVFVETEKKALYILSVIRDRTEYKETERKTAEAERHFRGLFENAPLSYQSLDADAVILDINPTWLKTVGFERDEVIGKKFPDFLTKDSSVHWRRLFPELMRSGEVHNVELEMMRKDGTSFFIDYEGKVAYDGKGTVARTHCIFTDITERKRTEEELQKMYIQTRKHAHLKDELLNEINHRVKNNLMTILGLVLAEKRRTRDVQMRNAESIWDDFEQRINGLLNVHQMLSDSKWAPLNISDLSWKIVSGIISVYEPERSVALMVGPSDITVSPRQANNLALVLNELATNSMKHAFAAVAEPEIRISFWMEEEMICIEFSDNGAGFPRGTIAAGDEHVGLHLVGQLVGETLRGKVKYINRNGAVTMMSIHVEEESRT
ncbi:MAG: PAS domain S-box protein [Acidobacteriota bacterium]